MGIGNSTLGGSSSKAWWDAWPQHTSAGAQQRARLVDEFEGVAPDQEEPVPPVTVAQVHDFEAERERQWRAPDPAGLPARWPAMAFQLWADLTQTVQQVRQASTPPRQIRSAPDGTAAALLRPEPDRLQAKHAFPVQAAATATAIPKRRDADVLVEKLSHQYLDNRLDELDPAFLSDYLQQAGYAELEESAGCAPAPQVLAALYSHLAPAHRIGDNPAGLERLDAQSLEHLMRQVMRELGLYGARDGQPIAPAFQRQVLIRLVSRWGNGCLQTPGRIAGYSWSEAARLQRTLTQIKDEVASRLQAFGLPQDVANWAGAMLLAGAEPALARADTPADLRYGSLEWADLQTGIDTATALGQEHDALTYTELVALARTSDIAARGHPDAAAALLAPQVRTALVFAGVSLEADDPQAGERIEQALTQLNDARSARWEAVQAKLDVLKALEAPLPMRRQMALRNLAGRHIDPHQRFLVAAGVRDPDPEQLPHPPIEEEALTLYLDGSGWLVERGLPDVDKAFDQAFTEYASHYRRAVQTLFDDVVQALPEQDRSFWQQGQAQILVPDVALDLKGMSSLSQWPLRMREQSAIVAVSHHGKARHYLVSAAGGDRAPIRLIADDLPYALDGIDHAALDQALLPYADDLYANAGEMQKARRRVWNFRSDGEPGPATAMVAQHFTQPVEALREQAYAPTANQQIGQVVRQTLLSLIPFYDCVTEARAGNAGGTAVSCGLDVVSLIPLIGTGIKLGVGAARLSIRLGSAALVQLARSGLSRQTLHMVAAQAAPLARYGTSGGKALARATVQWLDPGFELLGKMPAAARHAFMSTLRGWPDLKPLAARIHASLKRQPYRFDAQAGVWRMRNRAVIHDGGRQFAQIGGHDFELIDIGNTRHVPVLRVEGGDDARFALVDPRSGLAYGPQWVSTAAGFETLGDYRVRLPGKLPAADERGIVQFRQHDYIQVDGQHYPVRYDDAWQTWRIHKENNLNGYSLPVRYDASRGTWRIHDELGLRGGGPPAPQPLDQLPDEVIGRIASYLRHADIGRLTQVNRRLRAMLAQESQAGRLIAQARRVTGLAGFRALLGAPDAGVEAIRGLRRSQQDLPLAVLASRIAMLPQTDRLTAFRLIHDAVTAAAFPVRHRAVPLTALAAQISELPEDTRWISQGELLDAAEALPVQYRSGPVAALAGGICFLPAPAQQWHMLNRVQRATAVLADDQQVAPLAALAQQLSEELTELTDAQRLEMFDRILADSTRLADERLRITPLERLALIVRDLPESERRAAFSRTLSALAELVTPDRGPALITLMHGIRHLPSRTRPTAFQATLSARAWLTGQGRIAALATLLHQINFLPPGARRDAFDATLAAIAALSSDERSAPLLAAARQLSSLPEPDRSALFDRIRSALAELAPRDRAVPLQALAGEIAFLPAAARQRAFDAILPTITELAAPERGLALETLARNLHRLPETVRRGAFDQILPTLAGLAVMGRGVLLERLASQLSDLPGPERPGAFGRLCREIVHIAERDRRSLLHALLRELWSLPQADRPEAFRQFLPQVRLLPDERRAQMLDQIVTGRADISGGYGDLLLELFVRAIDALPSGDRYDAFTRALAAINRLGSAQIARADDLLGHLRRQVSALPIDQWLPARQLLHDTCPPLLRMAPDVRQHYADPRWVDRLAIPAPDPEGTPFNIRFRRVLPDGTEEETQRQYWTGSVHFGSAGNRNVLLEPVDEGGVRRWYLAGPNGERLSQYLERRYAGTLAPDLRPPL